MGAANAKYKFDIPPVSLKSSKSQKESEIRTLRQNLAQETELVNILIWGSTGVGKSTLVNSAVNAMDGEASNSRKKVAKSAAGGMDGTVHIRQYGAGCRTGQTLGNNMCIWDVMGDRQAGMRDEDDERLGVEWQQVLDTICTGKLPDKSRMIDRKEVLRHATKQPGNIDQRAHVLIVLISGQRQDDVRLALSVKEWANHQEEDIHVLIGLTHLDMFDKAYWDGYSNYPVSGLYEETATLKFVEKMIKRYGFDKGDIFPLVDANIFSAYATGAEKDKIMDADLLTLQLLDRAYQMGKEYRKELTPVEQQRGEGSRQT